MRALHILFLLLFCFAFSFAQNTLVLSYNNVDIGRNLSLGIEKKIKRHAFLIAAKYHFNRTLTDDQLNVFQKKFYAQNIKEHLAGIQLYYKYDLKKSNSIFTPWCFFDVQISQLHIRGEGYLPEVFDKNGEVLYEKFLFFLGPFTPVELTAGFGFQIKISKKFSLYQKVGGGVNFIFGKDRQLPTTLFHPFQWEFGGIYNAGIGYKLGRKKENNANTENP